MPRKIKISNQHRSETNKMETTSGKNKKSNRRKSVKSSSKPQKTKGGLHGSSDKLDNSIDSLEDIQDTQFLMPLNRLRLTNGQIKQNLSELRKTAEYLEIKNITQNPFIKAYKNTKSKKNRNNRNIKNNKKLNISHWKKESRPYFFYLNPKRFNCLSNEDQSIVIQHSKPYYYRRYLRANFIQKITKAFQSKLQEDEDFVEKFCLPFDLNKKGKLRPTAEPAVVCSVINVYEASRECKVGIFDGTVEKRKSLLKEFGMRLVCLVKSRHGDGNIRINCPAGDGVDGGMR